MKLFVMLAVYFGISSVTFADISFEGLEGGQEHQSSPGNLDDYEGGRGSTLMQLLNEMQILKQGFLLSGVNASEMSTTSAPVSTGVSVPLNQDTLLENVRTLRQKFDEVSGSLHTGGTEMAQKLISQALMVSMKKQGNTQLSTGTLECERVGEGIPQSVPGDYICSYKSKNSEAQEKSHRVLMCINKEGNIVCHQSVDSNEEIAARPGYEGQAAEPLIVSGLSDLESHYNTLHRVFEANFAERFTGGKTVATRIIYSSLSRVMAKKGNELKESSLECKLWDDSESPRIEGKYACTYEYTDEDDQTHTSKNQVSVDMQARVNVLK